MAVLTGPVRRDDGDFARDRQPEGYGQDWYVAFGHEDGGRQWADGRRFGFVAAVGGEWYSRTLRRVPVGARVWAFIPKRGYVGVGTTLAVARKYRQADVVVDGAWVRMAELPLVGTYEAPNGTHETAEYIVPVQWIEAVPIGAAYWETGMFANQNSACPLRQEFTLKRLVRHFNSGPA